MATRRKNKFPRVEELSIPSDYSLEETGITQSLLGSWLCCPRRFLYAVNRWASAKPSPAMDMGSCVHDVLEQVYKAGTACTESGVLSCVVSHAWPAVYNAEELERMRAICAALCAEYVTVYATDFGSHKMLETERTFAVKYGNVTLRGKKDGLFADKAGLRWLFEHKTKSRIDEERMLDLLAIDLQNLLYLVADEIESGTRAVGVLYNVMRMPDVRKVDKPKEVYEYARSLIRKEPDHYFKRWEVSYTEKQVAAFRDQLDMMLARLENSLSVCVTRTYSASTVFYCNPGACSSPYNCPYLGACSSGSMQGYVQRSALFEELDL